MDGAVAVNTIQQSVVGNLVIAVKHPVKMHHGTTSINVVLLAIRVWIHWTLYQNALQFPVAVTLRTRPCLVMDCVAGVHIIQKHVYGNLEIAVKQLVKTPHGHINMHAVPRAISVWIQPYQNALISPSAAMLPIQNI